MYGVAVFSVKDGNMQAFMNRIETYLLPSMNFPFPVYHVVGDNLPLNVDSIYYFYDCVIEAL